MAFAVKQQGLVPSMTQLPTRSCDVGRAKFIMRSPFFGASFRSVVRPLTLHNKRAAGHVRTVIPQASLIDRFGRVTKGYTFFYGDKVVKQLEDPIKMLDQAVIDMKSDLLKMKEASNEVLATQKSLEDKFRSATAASASWLQRAELALSKGEEELAREALKRRQSFQATADTLRKQLDIHTRASNTLLGNIRLLENKVSEAVSKKETLKARALTAQSSKMLNEEINNLVSGLRSNNSLAAFKAMEEKVAALEAEAESSSVMFGGDVLESRFALLEGTSSVDDDLVKLKADMMSKGAYKSAALPEFSSAPPKKYTVDIFWP